MNSTQYAISNQLYFKARHKNYCREAGRGVTNKTAAMRGSEYEQGPNQGHPPQSDYRTRKVAGPA